MANVFADSLNTPANITGWTVQNTATGTNQSLTGIAGVTGTLSAQLPNQAPLTPGTATTNQIATALNALNAAMVTAGSEHA